MAAAAEMPMIIASLDEFGDCSRAFVSQSTTGTVVVGVGRIVTLPADGELNDCDVVIGETELVGIGTVCAIDEVMLRDVGAQSGNRYGLAQQRGGHIGKQFVSMLPRYEPWT